MRGLGPGNRFDFVSRLAPRHGAEGDHKGAPASYRRAVNHRVPTILLLLALLGGLTSASVHSVHHAAEWAESRAAHLTGPAHADGEQVSTPCDVEDAHALDCAICGGLGGAEIDPLAVAVDTETETFCVWDADAAPNLQLAATPARGPPAAA